MSPFSQLQVFSWLDNNKTQLIANKYMLNKSVEYIFIKYTLKFRINDERNSSN